MFELAHPWILLAWLFPFLLWFLMPRAPMRLPAAMPVPFFAAMTRIVEQRKGIFLKQPKLIMPISIWILLIFAAAGPKWVGEPRPLNREGYNIMMVLDLSGSMEMADMVSHGRPVTRLSVVKRAAEEFVEARSGDRIGLILFGSRAYLQTPLTYDRHSVLLRLEDATAGLAGKTTSIGDALGLAVKHLEEVPPKGRVIILLTDGANNSGMIQPLKAAELARQDGIKVYTIGLGASSDARVINGAFVMPPMSADLDETTLEKIAKMTGGLYFRATDLQSLQTIYSTINQLETVEQEQATIRPQKDYYYWPLGLAIGLFFVWMIEMLGLGMTVQVWSGVQRFGRREEEQL